MKTKKTKQPIRHLRLLKPSRSGRKQSDREAILVLDSQRNLKKLGSPADFNIPKGLVPYLNRKIHDVGSLRLLLNQCIYKKWYLLSIPKQIPRDRIGYQKQKLELKRFSFRPFEDDWIELRRLAFLHKVSMCKMFVKLLETEFLLPNPNRLRLPGFDREQIPFPATSRISTNQHVQTEDLSILEEGKLIQVAG
ncbi:DUF1564 family protein [Leptospira borgpetersenii serovar Hardjo-bovis]|uniref:DUF1564 family protein n=1 Tax=Leptospira borgpetersenii TaxID=174 RepID=UPI000476FE05|nr:DUF1564 family protein [Leptospira borgpetersenii]MBE8351413.1 DUF1564 family protein [Leptospira borgpetersenii serovar Hardjo-bovis]MBE8361818.1 DUF1564 family protein [Leptospira borgpetersenii serovar Hardjo-bovis]MBE8371475.1 DUF1564 family protein [Leptospira borgpetersenii serovar Hardjo-bovis]MBE8374591.1 DUF1564 family protein [Leptospira borgpetersenii serovar Hardjo-bovis]MBE8377675.1 DUF1564 family protein [Leptospira borgpetersenii serovar Hardjo-bovis]